MLINEAARKCGITKKAVQYYVEQGLVDPKVLENGYRDFSEEDTKVLKRVVLYRKLGLSIREIRRVLEDRGEISGIFYQRELELEQEKTKQEWLKRLAAGEAIEDLEPEIDPLSSNTIIIQKLGELFPGYYGKIIRLHFSRYLTGKVETEEQKKPFIRSSNSLIGFRKSVCRMICGNIWMPVWKKAPEKRKPRGSGAFCRNRSMPFRIWTSLSGIIKRYWMITKNTGKRRNIRIRLPAG